MVIFQFAMLVYQRGTSHLPILVTNHPMASTHLCPASVNISLRSAASVSRDTSSRGRVSFTKLATSWPEINGRSWGGSPKNLDVTQGKSWVHPKIWKSVAKRWNLLGQLVDFSAAKQLDSTWLKRRGGLENVSHLMGIQWDRRIDTTSNKIRVPVVTDTKGVGWSMHDSVVSYGY